MFTPVCDFSILNPSDNPADTVSSIAWAPSSTINMLACSDWDSKIRIYELASHDTLQKQLVQKSCFSVDEPCLSVSWTDDMSRLFAGCIDNSVLSFDMMTGTPQNIGQHESAVRDVYWVEPLGLVCSLSFDGVLKLWDTRQPQPAVVVPLDYKVHCSDLSSGKLALGMPGASIMFVDLMKIQQAPHQNALSEIFCSLVPNESQLTAISFNAENCTIALGTHDGYVHIVTFLLEPNGDILPPERNIRGLNHKSTLSKTVYPVHSVGFNPKSEGFGFSAGGEGRIVFYEHQHFSRLGSLTFDGVPVTKAKTSPDGTYLAYALGYDWAKGIEGAKSVKAKVCVHKMEERELVFKEDED